MKPVFIPKEPSVKHRVGLPCYTFWCPGCRCGHGVWVAKQAHTGAQWEFNGDLVRPTIVPSLLVKMPWMSPAGVERCRAFKAEHGREPTLQEIPYDQLKVCHSFIRDGQIQFLSDSTHDLAGQTVPLPSID